MSKFYSLLGILLDLGVGLFPDFSTHVEFFGVSVTLSLLCGELQKLLPFTGIERLVFDRRVGSFDVFFR